MNRCEISNKFLSSIVSPQFGITELLAKMLNCGCGMRYFDEGIIMHNLEQLN